MKESGWKVKWVGSVCGRLVGGNEVRGYMGGWKVGESEMGGSFLEVK